MTVIARCEGCGYEYIVRPDHTVSLACDCALRDPDTPWSVVEMVPSEQLRTAVDALRWVADRYAKTLAGKSVRDADEALERARLIDEVNR